MRSEPRNEAGADRQGKAERAFGRAHPEGDFERRGVQNTDAPAAHQHNIYRTNGEEIGKKLLK
ncbi:hypothetical protein ACCS75_08630 [Rhizobium ruizarguesonis]